MAREVEEVLHAFGQGQARAGARRLHTLHSSHACLDCCCPVKSYRGRVRLPARQNGFPAQSPRLLSTPRLLRGTDHEAPTKMFPCETTHLRQLKVCQVGDQARLLVELK